MRRVLPMVVVALAAATAAAQSPAAWFGLEAPRGLSDPHKAIVDVTKAKPAPLVLPAGDAPDADLTGPAIYKDLERIVGFSRENQASGDKAWGRITGFSGAANAYNWAATRFKDAGLKDVQVQEYDGAAPGMWQATNWEARLLPGDSNGKRADAAPKAFVLGSAIPTSGSRIPDGLVIAELVYAGTVDKPIDASIDVKGKIAVQHLPPGGSAFAARSSVSTRARDLTTRGAVAVINVMEQSGNMFVRDFANTTGASFNVGAEDGLFLLSAMERARAAGFGLEMELTLDASVRTNLKGHNVIGIVPGKNDAENIVVNAHGDGWFEAAGDNGDGFATVLALARYFAKPANQPERTLVFVISGGHHSAGLNGPQNLVRMNKALLAKTVMVVNLEHIAQLAIHPGTARGADGRALWQADSAEQPMGFGISNQSPLLMDIGHRARQRYGFNVREEFGSTVPGDLGGYEPLGVARVQAIHSGPMYHTSGDTLDTISLPGLERAARFFAYFVTEAAKAPRAAINP
jgi:hypothetical protein